jgi:hypothetical protein
VITELEMSRLFNNFNISTFTSEKGGSYSHCIPNHQPVDVARDFYSARATTVHFVKKFYSSCFSIFTVSNLALNCFISAVDPHYTLSKLFLVPRLLHENDEWNHVPAAQSTTTHYLTGQLRALWRLTSIQTFPYKIPSFSPVVFFLDT